MNESPESRLTDARAVRTMMRSDLVAAMKARQPDAVAALRTAIAAIDNAEAVAAPGGTGAAASGHIAGAQVGLGSTEAERRDVSIGEVRAILQGQIADCRAEADRYQAAGHHEAAGQLRRQAEALRKYMGT